MEYCCVIWDPHQVKLVSKLEGVQRQAARFVANKPHRRNNLTSVTAILRDLGWDTLQHRRHKARLISFYKMVNHEVAIPAEYHPEKKPSASTRRRNNHQYAQHYASIQTYQQSFIPATIPLWNQLPEDVAAAPSVDIFKQRLTAQAM